LPYCPEPGIRYRMIKLQNSIDAWGSPGFKEILKTEIEGLNGDLLPLQQALTQSSYAVTDRFSAIILATSDNRGFLLIKAGIYYSGLIAGCNCADDPTPVDEQNEYCEIYLSVNKSNAQTTISLFE